MKKLKALVLLTLVLTMSAYFAVTASNVSAADSIISWGVRPMGQGNLPQPPAGSQQMLQQNNAMFVNQTQQKRVFLTFDLGYEAGYTSQVLDTLQQNQIKAVFFVCGNYLKEQQLVGRMIEQGHSMGNHTDKHKDLPCLDDKAIHKDIDDLQTAFTTTYANVPMQFFRPPQGRFSQRVLRIAADKGLTTLLWSIAIVDWGKSPIDATANANKIIKRIHNGAIILFHITNAGTPQLIQQLLPMLKDNGYEVGNPAELLQPHTDTVN